MKVIATEYFFWYCVSAGVRQSGELSPTLLPATNAACQCVLFAGRATSIEKPSCLTDSICTGGGAARGS